MQMILGLVLLFCVGGGSAKLGLTDTQMVTSQGSYYKLGELVPFKPEYAPIKQLKALTVSDQVKFAKFLDKAIKHLLEEGIIHQTKRNLRRLIIQCPFYFHYVILILV